MARGFRVDIDGLEALGADLAHLEKPGLYDAIRESLRGDGGEALASEMRQRAPRRTGTLVRGIGVHPEPGGGVKVGYQGAFAANSLIMNAAEQRGAWVESGTRPHLIKAKKAKSLFFAGHAIEEVQHPGSKGQGVARKSIRAAEWEVLADIVDKINAKLPHGVGSG